METFSALLAICAGNSPVPGEFLAQRPVTRSFDVYFDLSPNKRLSKQLWGWWFETQSRPWWRHRNELSVGVQSLMYVMAESMHCYTSCFIWPRYNDTSRWHHQMEAFSSVLAFCAGIFFDLRLKKRLSKQSRRRWLETPSHSLWRHCNVSVFVIRSVTHNTINTQNKGIGSILISDKTSLS